MILEGTALHDSINTVVVVIVIVVDTSSTGSTPAQLESYRKAVREASELPRYNRKITETARYG